MTKVKNAKAVSLLASRSFKANRTRNIIAIIAIALTALLFTSVFTIGMGTVESLQNATMRQAGGDGHAVLKYINDDQFNKASACDSVKEIAYNMMLCDSVDNEEFLKRHTEFWYYDEVGLKLGFCQPTSGNAPEKENEVIADTKTLELMGVPLEVGSPLSLNLTVRGKTVTRDFILSGWWESDPAFGVGQVFASRAYVDAHRDELQCTYNEDYCLTGAINAYVMFSSSSNLNGKLAALMAQCGFSDDPNDPNYVASNVNWSYLSTNFGMDAGTVLGLGCGLLLIILTGYLIIYNIFQISVIRDVRFYGLLKTIGTTGRQIRRMIRRQALILSAIGIPIGLVMGFFCGRELVPLIMNNSSYAGSAVSVSPSPFIFIGSAAFALVTVFISTLKPGRMAGQVSPVEAVRYTGSETCKTVTKKGLSGAKMHKMALANLGRSKKRTVLVVLSLSLSLILLNTVATLSKCIDMDKFVSKFVDTDFLIAHADFFNNDFYDEENQLTQSFIDTVEGLDGFEAGGRIYGGRSNSFGVTDEKNDQIYNRTNNNDFIAAVQGLEDFPLGRQNLLDGTMDMEKLKSGDYILEGVFMSDNGDAKWDSAHFAVGDKITLHDNVGAVEGDADFNSREFTVLGHVAIKQHINNDGICWDYNFYLPASVYLDIVGAPAVMDYVFNVADDNEADVEAFLNDYTDHTEPVMNYSSKATVVASLDNIRSTVVMVGGALGLVIAIIGVLNFVNSMLTSIISRKREFAMLQSIGMTRRQLRRMLCFEGLYYGGLTAATSILLGIICSLVVVSTICSMMWFFTYHFVVWPLLVAVPVLALLGIAIPTVCYGAAGSQTIVERLRDSE